MNVILLQKIEELTLYSIEQNKKVEELTLYMLELKKENEKMQERLEVLEK